MCVPKTPLVDNARLAVEAGSNLYIGVKEKEPTITCSS